MGGGDWRERRVAGSDKDVEEWEKWDWSLKGEREGERAGEREREFVGRERGDRGIDRGVEREGLRPGVDREGVDREGFRVDRDGVDREDSLFSSDTEIERDWAASLALLSWIERDLDCCLEGEREGNLLGRRETDGGDEERDGVAPNKR
jgi:hypothetical protein